MNESLDSISNFFNKLLNIKPKDSAREPNRSHSLPSDPSTTSREKMNRPKTTTTNKTTISFLKAGLSDILTTVDETGGLLSSGRASPAERATSSQAIKPIKSLESVQLEGPIQVAIDLTNEQDVKCLLNESIGCSTRKNAENGLPILPADTKISAENRGNIRNNIRGNVQDDTKDKCVNRPAGNDSSNKLEIKEKLDGNGSLAGEQGTKIADHLAYDLAKEPFGEKRVLSVADKVNESSTILIGKTLNGDHLVDDQTGSKASAKCLQPEETSSMIFLSENHQKQGENRSLKSDKNSATSSTTSSEPTVDKHSNAANDSNEVSTNKLNCKLNGEERSSAAAQSDRLPENGECLAGFVPPALFGSLNIKTFEEIDLECAKEANDSVSAGSSSALAAERPLARAETTTSEAAEDNSPATGDRSGLTGESANDDGSEPVSTF